MKQFRVLHLNVRRQTVLFGFILFSLLNCYYYSSIFVRYFVINIGLFHAKTPNKLNAF